MAEAFFKKINRCEGHVAISAGTKPDKKIEENIIKVMSEKNIDMLDDKKYYPKIIDEIPKDIIDNVTYVYTMGCGVKCPTLSIKDINVTDLGFDDVKGKSLDEVRLIRDKVRSSIIDIIKKIYLKGGKRCI
ncbi:arsenate reductase ArsC [archaeon]|nr:arsenate reductase ArsC [archaeon]MBT4352375.1 arsenate reductase ArsC [archaeon]MBT4646626.1 arsenate reductase ArsC [archaeon]MBT6821924.1 arsenate reductase ArsC [archaeon]MBT7393191.1 arsenate reductase ArsC [archaeon]